MLIMKCPYCGEEILIIPDADAMDKALKTHAKQHISEGDEAEKVNCARYAYKNLPKRKQQK